MPIAAPAARAADSPSPARPNIVIILADDMGFSDIGCFGSEISTPNIDRLATQGVRLTQFYNMARCCPALCQDKPIPRAPLFWEHEGNRAVRFGDWKLQAFNNRPWHQLHDLSTQQPKRVQQMTALYVQWANRRGVLSWPIQK